MADILNLALPYFGLIFIGFACGKTRRLPESGLAWMNFFLLYVSLPALLFRIMSETPFSELNNPPFLIATTLATVGAFVLSMVTGRFFGELSLRKATMAGLAGAYGNIGYMGPGLALAVLGSKAAAPTALIFCCDSIFLFTIVPLLMAFTDREHPSFLHAVGIAARQIVLNPLIMSAVLGALVAALHIPLPTALDRTLLFLQNAAAPTALFVLGVTVALRPFDRVPWEVPGVIAIKLLIHPLDRIRPDAAVRAVCTALGGDRSPDGSAAAGAECVRDRPPEQHLDRTGIGGRPDRHLRIRGHADHRHVVHPERTAGVSLTRRVLYQEKN